MAKSCVSAELVAAGDAHHSGGCTFGGANDGGGCAARGGDGGSTCAHIELVLPAGLERHEDAGGQPDAIVDFVAVVGVEEGVYAVELTQLVDAEKEYLRVEPIDDEDAVAGELARSVLAIGALVPFETELAVEPQVDELNDIENFGVSYFDGSAGAAVDDFIGEVREPRVVGWRRCTRC